MLRFIVFVVLIVLSMMGGVLYEGGSLLAYVVPSTLAVELLVPLFAMLAVWKLAEIGSAFRDALSGKPDSATRARSARIWEFAEKICYAAAIIALILGIVLSLGWLTISATNLVGALGASLTGPLYGLFFAIVCRILRARVER